jgi:hypothetical protein
MVAVMYAFKDTPNMSLSILEPLINLAAFANKIELTGAYADGFEEGIDGVPPPTGGWEQLIQDVETGEITHIVMPNFSKWHAKPDLLLGDLQPILEAGTKVVVAQANFINGGVIEDTNSLVQAVILVESAQYYKDVKGLRVRAGHRATHKNIGNTPYGMKNTEGSLVIDHDEMDNVRHIMRGYVSGISIGDIARTLGPDFAKEGSRYDKVYHVVQYWKDKMTWRSEQ